MALGFTPEGVVNAATFTPGIAPGGIMTIFGSGLAVPGSTTTIDLDGVTASILSAFPFQINAVVPATITPGSHVLRVRSPFGEAQQVISVSAIAPAIFLVGDPPVGAVTNQDNTLNLPSNALPRGQTLIVYATGLGTLVRQGQFSVTTTPVSVVLGGQELAASYAGAAPGFPGLYQVNVSVPGATPPGLGVSLTLKQGGQSSNVVKTALQ